MTRYTDLERIDSGAYATLYRARDTHLGRLVAIKFFNNPQTEDFVLLQARATVAIKNDHVVTVYDIIEIEHPKLKITASAITMELVEGYTLESILLKRVLSASECLSIAEQLLAGVGWIADNQGLHQDLHTGNILIRSTDNKVVIIDALGTSTHVFGRSRRRRIAHDLRSAAQVLGDILQVTKSEEVAERFEEDAKTANTPIALRTLFERFLSESPIKLAEKQAPSTNTVIRHIPTLEGTSALDRWSSSLRDHDINVFNQLETKYFNEDHLTRIVDDLLSMHSYTLEQGSKLNGFMIDSSKAKYAFLSEDIESSKKKLTAAISQFLKWSSTEFFPSGQWGGADKTYYLLPHCNIDRGGTGDENEFRRYDSAAEKLSTHCAAMIDTYTNYRISIKSRLHV